MAIPKIARVVATESITESVRILDLELEGGAPFGFRGGQYGIVNTGVPLPGDKVAKRAYSFFSDDREQMRVRLAVKRLDDGPGSNRLHEIAVGEELPFSGPWGKSYPDDAMTGNTLLLATDTGITAAMGLARSDAFARLAPEADLIWCIPHASSPKPVFLPEAFVRSFVEPSGVRMRVESALPIHHPERLAQAESIVAKYVAERGVPSAAFLSGDGTIAYGVRAQLVAMGMPEDRVKLEAFFNNPARKAP
jgi:ferredoxin-NADP reductase